MNQIVKTDQYVTFRLGDETFAIDVGNAREIVEFSAATQIPNTPPWIRGVLNLRGSVIPVLDLKQKFGMGQTERTIDTCVIVVETALDGELFVVGVLADSVREVFEYDEAQIEQPPNFGTKVSTEFLRGLGRRGEDLFIILDAERVFSTADFADAKDVAAGDGEPEAEAA